MLRESVNSGTSKKLKLNNMDIASKTGTVASKEKNFNSDAWNISYTPTNTLCVWIGATGQKQLPHNLTGSNLPTSLAQSIYLQYPLATKKFEMPQSISQVEINQIEYQKNNKIMLASSNTPERYKLKEIFAKDNLPKETSQMFSQIDDFVISGELFEDSIKIHFEAKKYLKYQIYCQNEDSTTLLSTIINKNGQCEIVDKGVKSGNFYTYYIVASYQNEDLPNVQKQSNKIKFYLDN